MQEPISYLERCTRDPSWAKDSRVVQAALRETDKFLANKGHGHQFLAGNLCKARLLRLGGLLSTPEHLEWLRTVIEALGSTESSPDEACARADWDLASALPC